MGLSNSKAYREADNELRQAQSYISKLCSNYLDFVESTNAIIDVNINELQDEIQSKINAVKSSPAFTSSDLTNEQKNQLHNGLEKVANMQKYSVRRLFETLQEAYDSFDEIASSISTCENEEDMQSDHDVLQEMRKLSMKLIDDYIKDLHDISFPPYLVAFYIASLRRMLYKGCDAILKEAISDYLRDCRDTALEEIDNIYCLGMTQGSFDGTSVDACRETLQLMILLNAEMREALFDLPFSHELIEKVQEDIQEHVQQIIRQVQLQFADRPEFLESIMDLDVEDDTDDFDGDDEFDEEIDIDDFDGELEDEEEKPEKVIDNKGGKKRKSDIATGPSSSSKKAKQSEKATPTKANTKAATKSNAKSSEGNTGTRLRKPPSKYE